MSEIDQNRRSERIRTRFETLYSSERQEGAGVLADISYSGALLEGTSLRPRIGSRVRVYILLPGRETPFELVGQVIRYTEHGFAIAYEKVDATIERFVDDAAGLVNAP
jgi:hypothetical protein